MTDELRTCLACGHRGTDVSMALVEYPDPQPVEIALPVAHDRSGRVTGNELRTVAGRFGSEWRCRDRTGCDGRLEDQARARAVADGRTAPW